MSSSPSLTRWSSHALRKTRRRSQCTSERSAGPTRSGQQSLTCSPRAEAGSCTSPLTTRLTRSSSSESLSRPSTNPTFRAACSQRSAKASLAGRREGRLTALAERIEGDGGTALAIPTDVTDEAQADAFIERTHGDLGGLDVLVNNAGVMLLGPVTGANTDEWRTMVNVNLLGLLYCTHAALPLIGQAGGGDIVNVSSVAGRHAHPGSAVYTTTKVAV